MHEHCANVYQTQVLITVFYGVGLYDGFHVF